MQFKSIQLKIAVLSGVCVLAATAGLVGYGIMAADTTRTYVGAEVNQLTEAKTREALSTLASTQAEVIRASLHSEVPLVNQVAGHIIQGGGKEWGGIGEPTISVAAPAVLNAYYKATGKRIRTVPLKNSGITLV